MADERFDLSYKGLIAPGADPDHARKRLTAIFKLTDKGVERLFTGKPVIVKRDVDAATAAQFEKVFAHAGAILTVTPVEGTGLSESQEPAGGPDSVEPPQTHGIDTSHLSLAPQGGVLEEPPAIGIPDLDLRYLSLVPGDNWTLEDCEPPPTPIPEPDLSYLSLEPTAPAAARETDPRLDR
jgi:hypothetical protein